MSKLGDTRPLPDVDAWDAWRPDELAARLADLAIPWAVAAGWAIELYVGGEPRPHDDLEIVAARDSVPVVRAALPELDWYGAGGINGERGRVWPIDDAPDELHQTWGWDRVHSCWRLDIFREPWESDTWVCRRDPSVRRPVNSVIEHTTGGIPYLAPEIVLLFKAKHAHEDKNKADLRRTLPLLGPERRRWLRDGLRIVHPGHEWLTLAELL